MGCRHQQPHCWACRAQLAVEASAPARVGRRKGVGRRRNRGIRRAAVRHRRSCLIGGRLDRARSTGRRTQRRNRLITRRELTGRLCRWPGWLWHGGWCRARSGPELATVLGRVRRHAAPVSPVRRHFQPERPTDWSHILGSPRGRGSRTDRVLAAGTRCPLRCDWPGQCCPADEY